MILIFMKLKKLMKKTNFLNYHNIFLPAFFFWFSGSYDKCAAGLRDRYKDDMAAVTSTIFSHTQVAKKNMLVTMLIDHLWSNEPGLTDELAATLNELTSLNRSEHSRVALRARQVSFCLILFLAHIFCISFI